MSYKARCDVTDIVRSLPSKQLGSETEAKFSRLQDVVPNFTAAEAISFSNVWHNFGTGIIEPSLFQRSAFNLVPLILMKSC